MRTFKLALAGLLALSAVATASAQTFPTVPDHSVLGRIGAGSGSGPSQAIPFSYFANNIFGNQSANLIYGGPSSGAAALPGFRALVTADFPANGVTNAKLAQGIANSILINPTGSLANFQNLAVPACANDGAHALVYINGTGLQCASITTGGTVTSVTCGTGLSGGAITTSGTCAIAQPYFQAVLAADQTVTTTVTAKLSFSSENFDSNNWYDNATNFRFTPLLAGKYLVNLQIDCNGTNVTSCVASIFKNGSTLSSAANASSAASQTQVTSAVTAIVSFNGSTDFIEGDANVTCTGTCKVLSSTGVFAQPSIFQAHYISP